MPKQRERYLKSAFYNQLSKCCQVGMSHWLFDSSVARSTEFSVDLPNSHKIYRSTDLNLKSTEKLLKKIFII
jgi:hypothetical protein